MATVNIPQQYQTLKTRLENVIKKVIEPQYVPNGSNLNDYTNVGMYYNGANAETTNITNLPNNDHTAFCLFVEDMGGNARKQTWTKQSDINSMFVRVKKWDNTWTSWKPVWEDTGWKDVTFKSGFAHHSEIDRVRYRRVGKVVELRGAVKNTNQISANTETTVATISDTTCRPSKRVTYRQQGTGINTFVVSINTDGTIAVNRYGTTSYSAISSGAWLNVHTTFLVD